MNGTLKLSLTLTSCILLAACSGNRPSNLGSPQEVLSPCPESPNCVSSLAPRDDETHYIAPIIAENADVTLQKIRETIKNNESAELIVDSPNYLYAEYTTALMRFVDDVEFLKADAKTIHVRSASRLGYRDFEVNRERVEALRSAAQ